MKLSLYILTSKNLQPSNGAIETSLPTGYVVNDGDMEV